MSDDNKNYPESKVCLRCEKDKPLEDYGKHPTGKYGRQSKCRVCQNEEKKIYNASQEGQAKNRQRANKWAVQNRERSREKARKYREDNLELVREKDRNRTVTQGEHRREQKRKGYAKYREEYKQRAAKWRKKNPSARKAISHNYRARKRALPNTLTSHQWDMCLLYWGCCAACGRVEDVYHADHWVPLTSRRCPGTTAGNIIPLCHSCNTSKNASEPFYWLKRQFPEDFTRIRRDIKFYFELASGGEYPV